MKIILTTQIITNILGSLILLSYFAPQHAISYFIGSFLILLGVFMLWLGFGLIFQKKLIALAIGIIVFKYAILGIIIFTLAKLAWFEPLWFSMGVASFILSAIVFALREASRKGKENVI